MPERVCPWWLGYFLASPLRRLFLSPRRLLEPYVRPGMTVLEPGPGMGFFTLELARLVGSSGRVIAIDVQSKMLAGLTRRAARARINDRIDARLASKQSMNISDFVNRVDFTLAFAVVHEMPSSEVFFQEAAVAARPSSRVLFVEPGGHVSDETFTAELSSAEKAGFAVVDRPKVGHSHAVLLEKSR